MAKRRADAPAVGAAAGGAAARHPLTERLAERAPTPTQRKAQRIGARTLMRRRTERAQRAGARTPAPGAQRIAERMERRETPRRVLALSPSRRRTGRIRGGAGGAMSLAGGVAGMRSPMMGREATRLAEGVAGMRSPMAGRGAGRLAGRVAGMRSPMAGREAAERGAASRPGTAVREEGRSRRGRRRRGIARLGRRGSPSRSRWRWRRWATRSRRRFRNW